MEELIEAVEQIDLDNSSDSLCKGANYNRINLHYGSKYEEDSFRKINIYPSTSELISGEKSYIRENIVNGPYASVYDYLDIHFRVLREDFVNPIREDICGYILNPNKKYFNIKVHEIQFLRKGIKYNKKCCCLEIKQSIENLSNIFKNQKRFMEGSLLLFTNTNFKTMFCGKVESTRNLKYNKLLVSFEKENVEVIYGKDYLMVECDIFFEPYYRVLKVLQDMPLNNFPMKTYIIDVSTSTKLPNYLGGIHPEVLDITLNKSQNMALRGALSQRCAIIQGPPGTGKTFLGLKLAKSLLVNHRNWWKDSPMLIISLTNHALDQFLEGLLDTTEKVLRLGAQSKSELLKDYTIPEMRKKFCGNSKYLIAPYYKDLRHIERKMRLVEDQLDNINTNKRTCIFHFSILLDEMSELQDWYFDNEHEVFVSWLLEDDGTIINHDKQVSHLTEDAESKDARVLMKLWKLCLSGGHSSYCMISTSILANAAAKLKKHIENPNVDDLETKIFGNLKTHELNEYYEYLMKKIDYLKLCLRTTFDNLVDAASIDLKNPFKIPVRMRWQLYNSWLNNHQEKLIQDLDTLIEEYKIIFETFHELSRNDTLELMKKMQVVGMTTTCAARMREAVEALKCPIVIVEEAAQVLEAHIIAALTVHCEHLILIGDHKQLKPVTSDYNIETKYKLGISLFERMVNNNIPYHVLNVQHRMRPEISSLITPCIYPELIDHNSVKEFPNILGIDKNVYFIDHTEEEEQASDASKRNLYEVKFLIQLAIYLINNNYSPEHITILAAYLGQKDALIKEQNNCTHELISKVKITTVDNFQGEENNIILLSLVRNNPNKKIGFLSTENRVCVALSRAKMGLYIMGNMTQLVAASKLWKSINKSLEIQHGIGKILPLRCQNHKISTLVSCLDDFQKVSDGGCSLPCTFVLQCGHVCTKKCHVTDEDHVKFQCLEPCNRSLCDNTLHKCEKKCFMECGRCDYHINSYLVCGHQKKCYMSKSDEEECEEVVSMQFSCGHIHERACHKRGTRYICDKI